MSGVLELLTCFLTSVHKGVVILVSGVSPPFFFLL